MMELLKVLRRVFIYNELSGNEEAAYRFSDADGRTGRSGYSFGVCQFDLSHNSVASMILEDMGFTDQEISDLKAQIVEAKQFNKRLQQHKDVIDKWDSKQIAGTLNHVRNVARLRNIRFVDDLALLAACDYHNQFFMSVNGKLATFCALLGHPVSAEEIKDFKMGLPWGHKAPHDVARRHKNLMTVWESEHGI